MIACRPCRNRHLASAILVAGAILFCAPTATAQRQRPATPGAASSAGTTRVVDRVDRSASSPAGGLTLSEALAAALTDPRDTTITFHPDLFNGQPGLIVLKQPLVIQGGRTGHLTLDGRPIARSVTLDASSCPDAGIILGRGARLTLRGISIRGGEQRSILLKDDAHLILEETIIQGAAGPGIAMFGRSRAVLSRSQISANLTHGIELHGDTSVTLDHVELRRNGQSGVTGFDKAEIIANDCHFDANGDWNLFLMQQARAELQRSLLRRGRFANVDLSGSSSLTLDECTVETSQRFGVFATGKSSVALRNSTLRRNGGRGLELQDDARLALDGSRVESNDDYGIILFGQTRVDAAQSVVAHNGAHGASLRDQASGTFADCVFTGNRYSGIGCLDAGDGGPVRITRSRFHHNGMRPIYRGPQHIDPLVPTPLMIQDNVVICLADPGAAIELFLDPAGEARQFHKTIRADAQGRFQIDCREIPAGWAMSATATVDGSTSEFNVIGGTAAGMVLDALLGRTGPLSDDPGPADPDTLLRRWKHGTRMLFHLDRPPSAAVERYLRFFVDRIPDWTAGAISAEVRVGDLPRSAPADVIVPIRYLPADAPDLLGRGGVTFMRWDAAGHFISPMEIILATGRDPRETCPRVLGHEIGHALGLCHTRVGLLSRMQGAKAPGSQFVNDFSPMLTYYDVLALQILHDPRNRTGSTLRHLADLGLLPSGSQVHRAERPLHPTFSPRADTPIDPIPRRTPRR